MYRNTVHLGLLKLDLEILSSIQRAGTRKKNISGVNGDIGQARNPKIPIFKADISSSFFNDMSVNHFNS